MRKFALLIVATLIGPPVANGQPTQSFLTLRLDNFVGRLVDVRGEPLPGARVSRLDAKRHPLAGAEAVTADAKGDFKLPAVPGPQFDAPGLTSLAVVTAEGNYYEINAEVTPDFLGPQDIYVPTFKDAKVKGPADVGVGELAGLVVDQEGKPLEDVEVHVSDWQPTYRKKTNKDGIFRIPMLGRGAKVEVRFKKPGYSAETFIHQPTGASGWVVALGNATCITGTVRDPDGKPAGGVSIRVNQRPKMADGVLIDAIWTETKSDDDGKFTLYLQPDIYELRVKSENQGVLRLTSQVVNRGTNELDLDLTAGIAFRAVVVDAASGEPVSGVRLSNWQQRDIEGRSNDDGLLIIPAMLPGEFQFEVSAASYGRWWCEECISDWNHRTINNEQLKWQRNFDRLDFDLRPGMPTAKIFVERGVRIRGRVVDPDGNPVGEATVAPALTGTGNSLTGDTRYSVPTKMDGTFEMLLPASNDAQYNLVAHDGKYNEWRKWANGVLPPISTVPGQEIDDVEIKLTRGATVRGQVTDADGKPVAFCEVRATPKDARENRYYEPSVKTGANGKFEIMFIRPGEQLIQVVQMAPLGRQNAGKLTSAVTLASGEIVNDFEFESAGAPALK
ncbi:MAG TPA: carboxypeptidase regulatory-like domain-containing protein [Pirellulales bacterium]